MQFCRDRNVWYCDEKKESSNAVVQHCGRGWRASQMWRENIKRIFTPENNIFLRPYSCGKLERYSERKK